MDPRVREAIELIETNLKAELRADDVARHLGLSVSRLQHLFKNETGTTLVRYLHGVRIERARKLLEETHLSVKQIVSEVGARDTSHFVREFRKAEGLSPKRYRINFLSNRTAPSKD
jgi:transcriptional regulator GlxA family with amidase domain